MCLTPHGLRGSVLYCGEGRRKRRRSFAGLSRILLAKAENEFLSPLFTGPVVRTTTHPSLVLNVIFFIPPISTAEGELKTFYCSCERGICLGRFKLGCLSYPGLITNVKEIYDSVNFIGRMYRCGNFTKFQINEQIIPQTSSKPNNKTLTARFLFISNRKGSGQEKTMRKSTKVLLKPKKKFNCQIGPVVVVFLTGRRLEDADVRCDHMRDLWVAWGTSRRPQRPFPWHSCQTNSASRTFYGQFLCWSFG